MATRTRTRLDVDARRSQLMRVGLEAFSSRPYDDVQMDAIAERAGVSRALLYHYFPGKREFYVAVVRDAILEAYDASEPDPGLPPLDRLRAGVDAWLDYVESHAHGALTMQRADIGSDPELRAIVAEGQARQAERLVRGIAAGVDPPPILDVAVRAWLRLVTTSAVDWLERRTVERDMLRDLLVDALTGLVLAARRADPELDRILPPTPEG